MSMNPCLVVLSRYCSVLLAANYSASPCSLVTMVPQGTTTHDSLTPATALPLPPQNPRLRTLYPTTDQREGPPRVGTRAHQGVPMVTQSLGSTVGRLRVGHLGGLLMRGTADRLVATIQAQPAQLMETIPSKKAPVDRITTAHTQALLTPQQALRTLNTLLQLIPRLLSRDHIPRRPLTPPPHPISTPPPTQALLRDCMSQIFHSDSGSRNCDNYFM